MSSALFSRRGRPTNQVVFASELAIAMGVHMRTVQRWIAAGILPGHRHGRTRSRLRVRLRDLDVAFARAAMRPRSRVFETLMRVRTRAEERVAGTEREEGK